MAKDGNGNAKLLRFIIPLIVALTLTVTLGIAKWNVGKTLDMDKALGSEIVTNEKDHIAFKNSDERLMLLFVEQKTMLKEQQKLVHRIDKTLTRIEEKLRNTP